MKRIFNIIQILLIFILLFSLSSCSNANSSGKILSRLEINKSSIELFVGDESRILAYSTTEEVICFSSTNQEVATVDNDGLVKGMSAGEAYIQIKAGDQEKSCKVVIKESVYSIELDYCDFNILVGATKQINATLFRNGLKIDKNVSWSVLSEYGTILVDGNSVVFTAVCVGATKLIASFENTSIECVINIVNV